MQVIGFNDVSQYMENLNLTKKLKNERMKTANLEKLLATLVGKVTNSNKANTSLINMILQSSQEESDKSTIKPIERDRILSMIKTEMYTATSVV